MEVLIDNKQKKHSVSLKMLREKAQIILNALDCPEGELSVLIVDDVQMAKLNQQYLNRQGPTNVLAFPMNPNILSDGAPSLFGDVVISVETAEKEGKLSGLSLEERLVQLLIHGILHLFDYDHEKTTEEANKMERKSNELLKLMELKTTTIAGSVEI